MSKVLKVIAIVAAVVAIAASAAVTFGATLGLTAALIATAGTIASVASVVATAASLGAGALAKPPKTQGSVSQVLIGANLPVPYCMGRSYSGGVLVYDVGYGGDKNSDRSLVMVHSIGGPVDSLQQLQTDYVTSATAAGGASGYYSGFLWLDWRNGATPDTALAPPAGRPTIPEWGSTAKLSGMAAAMITLKFDTDGKKFASGVPQFGIIAKWAKVYDPRLDSTYPGGSGTHRFEDETTWAWSENPGLHALAYCRGRFSNGKRVVGVGLPKASIDIPAFVELANISQANAWVVGGTVYEGPGLSKWDNLKRILSAAAAEPAWVGGQLTLKVSAPKVSLDELNTYDVVGAVEVTAMRARRERYNTLIPRYRSEAHNWEYVQADAVVQTTYLAEDGEPRSEERQFDLVQNKDQAAKLGAYVLANARELRVTLTAGPRFMVFRPGEALTLKLPEAGLPNQLVVITSRKIDPATGTIELTMESETTSKHAFALGQVGVAPPTPTITTSAQMDAVATDSAIITPDISLLITNSYASGIVASIDTAGVVTIGNHTRVYSDKSVSVTGATVTPATGSAGDTVVVFYDDPGRAGGAVTYQSLRVGPTGSVATAINSPTNPYRHVVFSDVVPASGTSSGAPTGGGGYIAPRGGPYP